jgi:hypothetical protein
MRDQLAAALCGGIERDRLIHAIPDTERLFSITAVYRGGGSIGNSGQVVDPPRGIQHYQSASHIRIDVGIGIFQRVTDSGLRREVDNASQFFIEIDQGKDIVTVGNIHLCE